MLDISYQEPQTAEEHIDEAQRRLRDVERIWQSLQRGPERDWACQIVACADRRERITNVLLGPARGQEREVLLAQQHTASRLLALLAKESSLDCKKAFKDWEKVHHLLKALKLAAAEFSQESATPQSSSWDTSRSVCNALVTAYTRADALDTAARQALSARCTAQHPHVTRAVGAEVRDEEALGKAGGAGAGAAGGLRQRWIYHGGGY